MKKRMYTYSFHKYLDISIRHLVTKLMQTKLQFIKTKHLILVKIHLFKHVLYVSSLFYWKMFSYDLYQNMWWSSEQVWEWKVIIWCQVRQKYTLSACFLNLFITENCWSLALTVSPKLTFGAFLMFCNHGWSGEKYKVIRQM